MGELIKEITHEIFDLDGTLYPYPKNFNAMVYRSLYKILKADKLSVSKENVRQIGSSSYKENGHSVPGLAEKFDYDFHRMYDNYHARMDVSRGIKISQKHAKALQDFYERCIAIGDGLKRSILTHSTWDWTEKAIERLRLKDLFERANLTTAEDYRFQNDDGKLTQFFKHDSFIPFLFECIKRNADPRETRMIEDSLKNLKIAKELGMQTVYINHGKPQSELPSYVDFQIKDIGDLGSISNSNTLKADFDHVWLDDLLSKMRMIIEKELAVDCAIFKPSFPKLDLSA